MKLVHILAAKHGVKGRDISQAFHNHASQGPKYWESVEEPMVFDTFEEYTTKTGVKKRVVK